ncbi:hypothetical protein FUAX_32540 [Fulvitalea axinellae]|uniref:Uncharacterized protein n=1 Tax=Fulvitalea axinellae TaxID=1182444 RepID=A0AAU9CZC7_9BACT|nr:hypothetical protein FUAX_32540 [Fulvitalea axinellae]
MTSPSGPNKPSIKKNTKKYTFIGVVIVIVSVLQLLHRTYSFQKKKERVRQEEQIMSSSMESIRDTLQAKIDSIKATTTE